MCDEAVDHCLEALTFIPDWLATSKMLETLDKRWWKFCMAEDEEKNTTNFYRVML